MAVARRLSGLLRPGDTLGRLSGDEFVILCEELADELQAEIIASRIVSALTEQFELPNISVEISGSIGVAYAAQNGHDAEQLLREADIAMYQVKRKGGGGHQVIDLSEHHEAEDQSTFQFDLTQALVRQQLHIEYQPIVRISDDRIIGIEALLRWNHPARGSIPRSIFLPIAEQSRVLHVFGIWVLESACRDRLSISSELQNSSLTVTVNVSAQELLSPGFTTTIASVLGDAGTDPKLLIIDINESALIREPDRTQIVLRELKQLGVTLALDDFGTGHSSLNLLKHFPLDVIKLDGSYFADIRRNETTHLIVLKTIELAHLLGLSLVAEGVETVEQYELIKTLGCDFYQGFYNARPAPIEKLSTYIRNQPQ